MQTIKYIMLFLLFISSTILGKILSQKYVDRVKELEDIKNALNIFKTKIKFTYSQISEIFEEISINSSTKNISKLFFKSKQNMEELSASDSWLKALEEISRNMNLQDEDIQKLRTLSKLLRNCRCRRANQSNRADRGIIGESNKTGTRRKTKK